MFYETIIKINGYNIILDEFEYEYNNQIYIMRVNSKSSHEQEFIIEMNGEYYLATNVRKDAKFIYEEENAKIYSDKDEIENIKENNIVKKLDSLDFVFPEYLEQIKEECNRKISEYLIAKSRKRYCLVYNREDLSIELFSCLKEDLKTTTYNVFAKTYYDCNGLTTEFASLKEAEQYFILESYTSIQIQELRFLSKCIEINDYTDCLEHYCMEEEYIAKFKKVGLLTFRHKNFIHIATEEFFENLPHKLQEECKKFMDKDNVSKSAQLKEWVNHFLK